MALAEDAVDVDEPERHVEHPQRRNLAHLPPPREPLAFLEEICVPRNLLIPPDLTRLVVLSTRELTTASIVWLS